jgi:hypothetical protein
LSLPPRSPFYSLQKIESRRHHSGTFPTPGFLSLWDLQEVDETCTTEAWKFHGALRLSTGHLFLREVLIARGKGRQVLLVEDGGLSCTLINRYSPMGKPVREVWPNS